MDAASLYHFLFETYAGIGVLVGAGLVISLILCFVMERKTRRTYKDRGPSTSDDWSLFDDDDEEEEEEAPKKPQAKPAPKKVEKTPEIKRATVRRHDPSKDAAAGGDTSTDAIAENDVSAEGAATGDAATDKAAQPAKPAAKKNPVPDPNVRYDEE